MAGRFRYPRTIPASPCALRGLLRGNATERQAVHGALAEATDRATDHDRRIWHLAESSSGPDEEIAAERERAVRQARTRGPLAAAAAFHERAALLTVGDVQHAERAPAAPGTRSGM
jgi:hypothetical protein